jgi:hypothetical protein
VTRQSLLARELPNGVSCLILITVCTRNWSGFEYTHRFYMVSSWRAKYGRDGITPAIELWLGTTVETEFPLILEDAKRLLGQFQYGKIARFASGEISVRIADGKLFLGNYRETGLSLSGHCGEVNFSFYGAMRIKYPALNMLQCEGARGGFSQGWNHWFTLVSEEPFTLSRRAGKSYKRKPVDTGRIGCFDRRVHILPETVYLLDPTGRTCSILDEREYSLVPPQHGDAVVSRANQNDLVISLGEYSFSALTVLGMCPETKAFLSIGLAREFPGTPVVCVQKWIGDTSADPGVRYDSERLFAVSDPRLLACVAEIAPGVLAEIRRMVVLFTS